MRETPQLTQSLFAAALVVACSVGPMLAGEPGHCDQHSEHADVYTVEGDVQKPERTGGPVPEYPASGKDERIEGVVVARLLIEKDGAVSDAEVVRSLRDDFDSHTLEAVRQWTFEPASLDGESVRVHYDITVNYRLDGGEDEAAGDET